MTTVQPQSKAFERIQVTQLMLDHQNPRLPEGANKWSVSDIVAYFKDYYALDEIIESMLNNGFFQQEPLIVLSHPDTDTGHYMVVEGNRRLASLMYIHGVIDDEYLGEEPSDEQLARLEEIPCVLVDSREDVRTYLGFRHIGGIKDWRPEAKARFICVEVDALAVNGEVRPFYRAGRSYGSNSQGIRNLYVAFVTLLHARDEFGINVQHIQYSRFGVWQRLLNSATVRDYIGFGRPGTYAEIHAALGAIDENNIRTVITDLTPQRGRQRALVSDSRQITDYGKVLAHPGALRVLRDYGSLDAAMQVVRTEDLAERIEKIAAILSALVDEVIDAEWSDDLEGAVGAAYREVRKMQTEIASKDEGRG